MSSSSVDTFVANYLRSHPCPKLKDLMKNVSTSWKSLVQAKKDSKPKTAYQVFLRQNMQQLKGSCPDPKERMRKVQDMWRTSELRSRKPPKPSSELKPYQRFVREMMPAIRTQNPDLAHPRIMSLISALWKEQKQVYLERIQFEDPDPQPQDQTHVLAPTPNPTASHSQASFIINE